MMTTLMKTFMIKGLKMFAALECFGNSICQTLRSNLNGRLKKIGRKKCLWNEYFRWWNNSQTTWTFSIFFFLSLSLPFTQKQASVSSLLLTSLTNILSLSFCHCLISELSLVIIFQHTHIQCIQCPLSCFNNKHSVCTNSLSLSLSLSLSQKER